MRVGPGGIIGIIGGGQLGKMLAVAAARLGYKCHVFAPDADPCAAAVAAQLTSADYSDVDALRSFAAAVDVATYEFENIPASSLAAIEAKLRPGVASLQIGQDRAVEKQFIERAGGRVGKWVPVDSEADAHVAEGQLGLPLVLKTRRLGYDGKGQAWAHAAGSAVEAWESIGRQPAVAEARVDFEAEFSVILARSADGEVAAWDPPLNEHRDGILRLSSVPAGGIVEMQRDEAIRIATGIAEALGHIGVLTIEFFACHDGPIVNEIAPRVHNSGHWTIEGAATSQFEQHIRAVCSLPLGSPHRITASASMDNLIGDDIHEWPRLVAEPGAHVHIYGKGRPRSGRKMGHVTRLS
ncbi:MAG: 5-(carboxyamino)imidazole ribonucleotide synthase [Pseudomonadota bacterium]|nr:5-(carboxyamino)imidazole ribonucleotide synthase [Pseudomonadota bacterium]